MKTVYFLIVVLLANSLIGEKKTVSYVGIDGKNHDIEIYSPKNHKKGQKVPCAIFFHGGGWSRGSLSQFQNVCAYFASRGMVAMTANYSMHKDKRNAGLKKGESRKRICVIDGKSVIRWAISNADKLGIDPNNIVVGGASAGGHISVLSLLDQKFNNPKDPKVTIKAKAALLFCPAFTVLSRDKTPEVNVFNNLGGEFPPMAFFTGEKDAWEKASRELLGELRKKGTKVDYWLAKGEGHMFHGRGGWYNICLIKADDFLVNLGILKGKTSLSYKGDKSLIEIK